MFWPFNGCLSSVRYSEDIKEGYPACKATSSVRPPSPPIPRHRQLTTHSSQGPGGWSMSDSAISTPAQLGASWQGLQSGHPGNDEVRRLRVPSAGPWSYFTPKSQEGRGQDSEGAGLQITQFTDLNSRSDEGVTGCGFIGKLSYREALLPPSSTTISFLPSLSISTSIDQKWLMLRGGSLKSGFCCVPRRLLLCAVKLMLWLSLWCIMTLGPRGSS